jgi:hypothetical protein
MKRYLVNSELQESGRGLIIRFYLRIRLEGLRKTTKNLGHDSRSRGRDLNPGSPVYEAGVLVALPKRLVMTIVTACIIDNNCKISGNNSIVLPIY